MFDDRRDAGRRLAALLARYETQRPVVVAMPRGGVLVGAEIARQLRAPLDIIVVRKLGSPWQPELGIGAIAEGGVSVLNDGLIAEIGVGQQALQEVMRREDEELQRRVQRYRGGRPATPLNGRLAILVDDGLATGYTARAAIAALRKRGAAEVVLAVPVAPGDAVRALSAVADEVIAVETPPFFFGIGEFYADFRQTSDEEVIAALGAAAVGREESTDDGSVDG